MGEQAQRPLSCGWPVGPELSRHPGRLRPVGVLLPRVAAAAPPV